MSEPTNNQDLNLEIGPGQSPLLGMLRNDLKSNGPAVFMDRSHSELPDLHEDDNKLFELNDFSHIITTHGEAANPLIPDETCQTILAVNVLGHIKKSHKGVEGYAQLDEIVESLVQKTRAGGKVIILETYSPNVSPEFKVIEEFHHKGFKLVERYDHTKLDFIFEPSKRQHPFVKSAIAGNLMDRYALVFEKPKS